MIQPLAIILLGCVISACGYYPEFDIDDSAKKQFASLPGKIGITLENDFGGWHRIVQQGRVIRTNSLPKASPEAATILRESFRTPAGLPPTNNYVYWGPYLTSPNGRLMAASIAVERHAPGSPGIVIFDKQVHKTVAILRGNENVYIRSLAWSPDSKWVALLKATSQLGAFDRFLISLTGHADPYMTWYLEVVDLTGVVVAQSKLTDLRGSWGWVVWLE
jgi:hypothetical protein